MYARSVWHINDSFTQNLKDGKEKALDFSYQ
jgi:hypothetical protein